METLTGQCEMTDEKALRESLEIRARRLEGRLYLLCMDIHLF